MIIIWIIVAIIMFMLIIIIHEFWHFSAARKFWVKVEEFWVWIPPFAKKLFTDKKWTRYTLNWLPLGGFVRLKWENPDEKIEKNDKEAFVNKNYFQKSVILLAGVFMNFVLAIIIFSVLFFIWVKPIWINSQIETNLNVKIIPTKEQALESWFYIKKSISVKPIENSIAEKSGIINWDILLRINNKVIENKIQAINIIKSNSWKQIELEFNSKKIKVLVWEKWQLWMYLKWWIERNNNFEYKYWFTESIKYWVYETYWQTILTFKWISILFKNIFFPETQEERSEALNNMKWPIWIVELITKVLETHWVKIVIILWAIISINLWVFNLLPIPALDWWRFLLITINSLFSKIFWKKAINQNFENLIHVFFFIVLIWLSLIIWYNDILNIFK